MIQSNPGQGEVQSMQVDAIEAQRPDGGPTGEYECGKCQAHFHYQSKGTEVVCPKCHNDDADSLTPIYTESDPKEDQMMGNDEFSAGD